jgi:hypothetical protein
MLIGSVLPPKSPCWSEIEEAGKTNPCIPLCPQYLSGAQTILQKEIARDGFIDPHSGLAGQ